MRRTGADVENTQLFHAQTAANDEIQGRFNDCFRVGPRDQNVRRDLQ